MGYLEKIVSEEQTFPLGRKVVINLPKDMHDGRKGWIIEQVSERNRKVDFDGEGLGWLYCIAALKEV